ncbi:MAG: hypothetical protein IJY42_04675, partial [Clostridia bacterium]|nr:hypothetical protein [Clostridia bacterium]
MAKKKSVTQVTSEKIAKKAVNTAERAGKKAVKEAVREAVPKKYRRSLWRRIVPYAMVVAALILLVCYIMVWVLEADTDGAGIVGYAVQAFFCGCFGAIPAFLLAPALGYTGVLWCIFHVKYREEDANAPRDGDVYAEYKRARRNLIWKTVTTFVALLLLSAVIGGFYGGTDPDTWDFLPLYEDGCAEIWTGGALGGLLSFGFVACLGLVASEILLLLLFALCVLLMCGLTPDYIITKLRYQKALRDERREAEDLAFARKQAQEEKRAAARPAPAEAVRPTVTEEPKKTKRGMTVDELVGDEEEAPPVFADPEPEIVITVPTEEPSAPEAEQAPVGEDYGGDPAFDANEYVAMDSVLSDLGVKKASSAPEAAPADETIALGEIATDELLGDLADVTPEEGAVDPAPEELELPYV